MAVEVKWLLLLCMFFVTSGHAVLRCPSTLSTDMCEKLASTDDEYFFNLNDEIDLIVNYNSKTFEFICPDRITIESKFLPVFDELKVFHSAKISKCHTPEKSYADALLALNITVRTTLTLDSVKGTFLQTKHFDGLNITSLAVSAAPGTFIRSDTAFIESLPQLVDLRLTNVLVDAKSIRLPPNLKFLKLDSIGLDSLPTTALAHMVKLDKLFVTEMGLRDVDLSAAPTLHVVQLTAEADGLTLAPTVEDLSMINVRNGEIRGNCLALRDVKVYNAMTALPARWLARCPNVDRVTVTGKNTLGARDEWGGASSLLNLTARHCNLTDLPTNWLVDAYKLEKLDLSYNNLESLPSEMFGTNTALRFLDLSHNRLLCDATAALGPLVALRTLNLSQNPLGDLCEVKGNVLVSTVSSLRQLPSLEYLYLSNTGATRVCRDWRTLPHLRELDLRNNNFTHLQFEDTQWSGKERVRVDMRGSHVSELVYTREDYAAALGRDDSPLLEFSVDWALPCDCAEYWAARALQESPAHAPALANAVCATGQRLRARPLTDFVCDVPTAECPKNCTCVSSPVHSVLRCADAALRELPTGATSLPPVAELLAPRNRLQRIAPLAALRNVNLLDVSENNITFIDAETADVLFSSPARRVMLAGNRLDCGCESLALLRAVADRPERVADIANVSCTDGRGLAQAARLAVAACGPASAALWPSVAAVAVLLLLLAALLIVLTRASPAARARIKQFLFERGLCLRWILRPAAEDDDDAMRPYDAFVSFSHLDAEYAHELAARLESGARPLRLCLHERDWTPGEWIPAQIASSVRDSRRTLVLLSEHFLSSDWARAELREAYAAALGEQRPRLLVVLLPGTEPAHAAATPELRAYIAAVTYLRWDDPRFWDKLRLALPPPRNTAQSASAPAKHPPVLALPHAPHPTPTAA